MAKRIYKYEVKPNTYGEAYKISMPKGAQPLSVGAQGDQVFIWVMIDDDHDRQEAAYYFRVLGTGWAAPEISGTFLGTAFCTNGLEWHIFEEGLRAR